MHVDEISENWKSDVKYIRTKSHKGTKCHYGTICHDLWEKGIVKSVRKNVIQGRNVTWFVWTKFQGD
jgi:hypothetical protein